MAVATPSPFFLWILLVAMFLIVFIPFFCFNFVVTGRGVTILIDLVSSCLFVVCGLWVLTRISSFCEILILFGVVSELTTLHLSPSLVVEKSPGLKSGTKIKCERIQIYGVPRLKHLNKYANSVELKVSPANRSGRSPNIEMCFHRNLSLGMAMCPQDRWERFTEGLWIKSMSPFDHNLLDIRMEGSYSETLQVSLAEEFFLYRVIFLFWGILMLALASWLSESLIFYYSGAMAVGVFLVALMVLFQVMKLLPTGRKSSLAIFLYSCFVGLGTFLLRYVPRLFRSLLIEVGLSEDIYDPVCGIIYVGFYDNFWSLGGLLGGSQICAHRGWIH